MPHLKMFRRVGSLFNSIIIQEVLRFAVDVLTSDTPQFRGGNPYFFNENLYQSVSFIYASMYSENGHAIHIAMQFTQKS